MAFTTNYPKFLFFLISLFFSVLLEDTISVEPSPESLQFRGLYVRARCLDILKMYI